MNVEGLTYYPLYNGHGDIVQLTNAAGEVVAWYQYDAWGNMTSHSEDTDWAKNPYRYSGYRYDDATGLYYLNARYYDPSVGRFLSPDAVYETPEYSYALDNPIHLSDPSGLRPMCQCEESFSAPKYSYETAWWEENVNAILRPFVELGAAIAAESKIGPAMIAGNVVQIGMDRADAKRAERSCNCFTAGTKVLTDEGEKSIEEIQIGDKVLSKDDTTGEMAYKEVEWLFQREVEETYNLTVDGQIITTTDEHPFWIVGQGWVEAKSLKVGDVLTTSEDKEIEIDKIEIKKEHTKVYNFMVRDFHSYFVSNLGIWTHNSCGYKTGDRTPGGLEFSTHGAERANERKFTAEAIDNIVNNNKKTKKSKVDEHGRKTWEYVDARGNKVVLNDSGGIVSVHSPASRGTYILKKK